MTQEKKVTKGYKVTDADIKCYGYRFNLGPLFTQPGELKLCSNGFHFCEKLSHCFNYYSFDKTNNVFEIEAYGEVVTDGNKSAALEIRLIRHLTWEDVLKLANEGADNTGHSNTGDSNTGDRNTGDRNTGDSNTGDRNTGDSNTGYSNTGDRNTGDSNTGDRNTGDSNTGDSNTGYSNTGDRNTGYSNTGYRNTGYSNTGYRNTGDRNTGDRNTGDSNTGYSNTGYSNTGDRNTGAFCTGEPAFPMFNKPSNWTAQDFLNSRAWSLMCQNVDTKIWIPAHKMTEEEKKKHIGWERAEGFYRDIPFKEAFTNAWGNWHKSSRHEFINLPNFDPEIFEFITGVKIDSES